ncbi:type II toxin-antitoxin system PemK/MazF family toxin [Sandaracinobacter neustonicus]|uniref:mRNA interferase n=1 Tax=Sandaracinobacter neustonicus TaxID=1715348 RepID=A0A501XLJ4_9SPHN|nr:type II toxin-antitoxin system PemK/MazF family toxin [Sandaracinobacter neustonicus]
MAQGEIWWVDLGEPQGSEPGYHRPVIVLQCDALNASRIATLLCVPLTSNLKWASFPGNVLLTALNSGLDRDCVAMVSQPVTLDKRRLQQPAGQVARRQLLAIFDGLDRVLGR